MLNLYFNNFIDHLKEKLNFNLEDLSKLSGDDFRCKVDCAINQVYNYYFQ